MVILVARKFVTTVVIQNIEINFCKRPLKMSFPTKKNEQAKTPPTMTLLRSI
jgi:hypothetical protein